MEVMPWWPLAAQQAIEAYKKNMKPIEKTEEEIKDETIRVKAPLPTGSGNKVDFYA